MEAADGGGNPVARVLIIDDDLSSRLMVREVLEPAGFDVVETADGYAGLERVESFRPDLVLLDVVMPDMDGFATLEAMRQGEYGAQCPIVMVTGLQAADAVDRAYELGATDFITKPIHWPLLRQRVRYLIRSHRLLADLRRRAENLERKVAGLEERIEESRSAASHAGLRNEELLRGLEATVRDLSRTVETMRGESMATTPEREESSGHEARAEPRTS